MFPSILTFDFDRTHISSIAVSRRDIQSVLTTNFSMEAPFTPSHYSSIPHYPLAYVPTTTLTPLTSMFDDSKILFISMPIQTISGEIALQDVDS